MKEIIKDTLATTGLGDEGWNYLDDKYDVINYKQSVSLELNEKTGIIERKVTDWKVVDCRDMEDGPGNPLMLYEHKIYKGIEYIRREGRVLVGCLAGISRSNSIAAGILMKHYGHSLESALDLIRKKVEFALIEPAHINALKKLEKKWKHEV